MKKQIARSRIIIILSIVMVTFLWPLSAWAAEADNNSDIQPTVATTELETQGSTGIAVDEAHFPDAGFRAYVTKKFGSTLTADTINNTNEMSIWPSDGTMKNVKGIEYFTSLKKLVCDPSGLESFDISKNKGLTELSVDTTNLSGGVDVSQNYELTKLSIQKLSSIDVSHNPKLQSLDCSWGTISSLDISHNPELTELVCYSNPLKTLDVRSNPKLEKLSCMDDQLSQLDLSQNSALKYLDVSRNNLTSLDISHNTELQTFYSMNHKTDFEKHESNHIDSIDFSKNVNLESIGLRGSNFKSIDVSQCKKLKELYCMNNELTSLNVNGATALTTLICNDNHIIRLDVGDDPVVSAESYSKQSLTTGIQYVNTNGQYQVRLSDLGLNSNDYSRISMTDGGTLDSTTGIVTYSTLPTDSKMTYQYQTNSPKSGMMDVSVPLTEGKADQSQSISYKTHVQDFGWQNYVKNGETSGTVGQSKRLEAIQIKLDNASYSGSVRYKTHIQNKGWESSWKSDDAMSGSQGESLRLEAIQIELTGQMASHYDVYYRVHCQNIGWMGWAKDGEMAGSSGYGYRLEGIEIQLVQKGGTAPGKTDNAYKHPLVQYNTHVQDYGWQANAFDGDTSGTVGQAKRLEAIHISLNNQEYTGSIRYKTHIQNVGWESQWKTDGAMSGTQGQSLRLEAIQIELTGEMANHYDVYYRVHAQNYGWLDWAKNGSIAGTTGHGFRLEGIQICLVAKNGPAPGATDTPVIQAYDSYEAGVMYAVNRNRKENGLAYVTGLPKLHQAAAIRSDELLQAFSHTRPDGSSCFTVGRQVGLEQSLCGENIAAGYPNAEAVVDGWMHSAGHRANILNTSAKYMGLSMSYAHSGYGFYWAQLFAY